MTYDPAFIREDFDRIAAADDGQPSPREALQECLLADVPEGARTAIDLGCGTGGFTRLLAARCERVIGLDLSPRMLELARARSSQWSTIEWRTADFMDQTALGAATYDVVSAVATLHHMPLESSLARAAALVAPGGVLLVLDLYRPAGLTWLTDHAFSWAWSRWLDRGHAPSPEFRSAWQMHGAHDVYPVMRDVRALAAGLTPGAKVRKRLLWRWSLVWHRPGDSTRITTESR